MATFIEVSRRDGERIVLNIDSIQSLMAVDNGACVYIAYINGTGGVTVKGSIDTILLSCQIAKNNDWYKQAEINRIR